MQNEYTVKNPLKSKMTEYKVLLTDAIAEQSYRFSTI